MENADTKELSVLKGEATRLGNQAQTLAIATPEEYGAATELKAKLRDLAKKIKERKEAITKPLNEALKSARELFAPIEASVGSAEDAVGTALLAYKRAADEAARKAEEKIAAKVEAGKMSLETAEKKLDAVDRVEKTVHTAKGDVQFRKIKKVRITDETKVPDRYWVLDMVAVRRDALAGTLTEGCEVYEEETV